MAGLALSRNTGESVVLSHGGERLDVMVIDAHGSKARLLFAGPRSFVVHRAEVQRDIDRGINRGSPPPDSCFVQIGSVQCEFLDDAVIVSQGSQQIVLKAAELAGLLSEASRRPARSA